MMVLDGISTILYHPRLNLAQGVHPGPDLICKEYKKGVGKFNEIFMKMIDFHHFHRLIIIKTSFDSICLIYQDVLARVLLETGC